MLLDRGQITDDQLLQARNEQSQTPGRSISHILLTMNAATEAQILAALAEQLGLPFEQPEAGDRLLAFELLTPEHIRKHSALPIRFEGQTLVVGMIDPTNVFLLDEIRRKTKRSVKIVVTTAADIAKVVELLTTGATDIKVDEIIKDMAEDDVQLLKKDGGEDDNVTDLEKMGSESPIIRFVNYVIFDAIAKAYASDIHIEPKEKQLKVRYRIDGVLFEAMNPPWQMHPAIVSRLKIMSNLDISERRLPQDGRVRAVVHGRVVDLRLSTLPTVHGEKSRHANSGITARSTW